MTDAEKEAAWEAVMEKQRKALKLIKTYPYLSKKLQQFASKELCSQWLQADARGEDGEAWISNELYHHGLPYTRDSAYIVEYYLREHLRRAWLYGE